MAPYNRVPQTRAANDNLSPLKLALRDWADRERMVGGNAKSLLCRLASHADAEDATVYICRHRFAGLVGVKVRTITASTRRLIDEGLIAETGDLLVRPSVAYKVYLLAPHEAAIQALVRRAGRARSGSFDNRSGEFRPTYKEDSKSSNLALGAGFEGDALPTAPRSELMPVPEDVRLLLAQHLTKNEMFSYVNEAKWRPSPSTLITNTEQARSKLAALLPEAANDFGFAITSKRRDAAHV